MFIVKAIHPGDVLKTRMQIMRSSPTSSIPGPIVVAKDMIKHEGICSLYNGLSAALMRQAIYTTLRLGLYDMGKKSLSDFAKQSNRKTYQIAAENLVSRVIIGASSGVIASFLSCPVEICLVRMQGDG